MFPPPLFADVIVQVISFLLFLLFMFGGAIFNWITQQAQKNRNQNQRRPQPNHPERPQQSPATTTQEISDFLRRTSGEDDHVDSSGIQILDPPTEAEVPIRRLSHQDEEEIPVAAVVVDDGPQPGSMEAYLKSHGYDTPQLEEKYDYKVGTLGDSSDDVHEKKHKQPSSQSGLSVDTIGEALKNPQDIRRAIILTEVLNRPTDRWN